MSLSISFPPLKEVNLKNEILAGLTVTMTMIPESLSFAILAGLSPLTGLYAAFLMGIITAILGGRPGMVSGGAGATIIVMIALIARHGVEYLFAAVVLGGILQVLVGALKWGKFVRLIPQPVMYGFLNGLAIVIFMAQVSQFQINVNGVKTWMTGTPLLIMSGLTLVTILIVFIFPKISKAIPASLVAIITTTLIVYFGGIDTRKIIDIASVSGSLPSFHIPGVPFNLDTFKIIFPYAIVMAAVGLIESLLTLNMTDELTGTKGNANQESIAQGTANIFNGFFGGMGGCAMVAQTLVNINAGARTRYSAIIGALGILAVILVGSAVIEQIPLAALIGVMMLVAIKTFQWAFLKTLRKMPKADVFVGITVAAITVVLHNLAIAVLVGVIISALVFAWENAKRIRVRKSIDSDGIKVYEVYGPLFFGSTTSFMDKFNPAKDPGHIIIDFKDSRVADMTAIECLNKLTEKYRNQGKKVTLRYLSADSIRLLRKANTLIDVNIENQQNYKVVE